MRVAFLVILLELSRLMNKLRLSQKNYTVIFDLEGVIFNCRKSISNFFEEFKYNHSGEAFWLMGPTLSKGFHYPFKINNEKWV